MAKNRTTAQSTEENASSPEKLIEKLRKDLENTKQEMQGIQSSARPAVKANETVGQVVNTLPAVLPVVGTLIEKPKPKIAKKPAQPAASPIRKATAAPVGGVNLAQFVADLQLDTARMLEEFRRSAVASAKAEREERNAFVGNLQRQTDELLIDFREKHETDSANEAQARQREVLDLQNGVNNLLDNYRRAFDQTAAQDHQLRAQFVDNLQTATQQNLDAFVRNFTQESDSSRRDREHFAQQLRHETSRLLAGFRNLRSL